MVTTTSNFLPMIDDTKATDTEPELSDDSRYELDGISSLFHEHGGSDLTEDDECFGDDYQESIATRGESDIENSNTELSFSDSETDNTTEPEVSDDSMCELDGISSLFDEHGMFESVVGEDDECCYQHANDERKSVDNEDADAVINYDQLQSCVDEDSLCLLNGESTLFEEHKESEYGDFTDDEERTVGMLGERQPEDKQEPSVQSAPEAGHWETAVKSLKIVAFFHVVLFISVIKTLSIVNLK